MASLGGQSESQFSPAAPWEKFAFLTYAAIQEALECSRNDHSMMKDAFGGGEEGPETERVKSRDEEEEEAGQGNRVVGMV